MRNYINITEGAIPGKPIDKPFAFLASLAEARRPLRRRPLHNEPEPEPEEPTLHGDLGDTAEQGAAHLRNLKSAEFGDDEVSDPRARASELGDDEEFTDFLHRKSVETGKIIPSLWRQIRNLPNYILNNVRAIGRMIFARLTDTPIDDIYVLADAFGDDATQVRQMIEWLQRYGQREHFTPYDFSNVMPGYQAKQVLYGVDDYQFLTVRDAHGLYVYAWKRDR